MSLLSPPTHADLLSAPLDELTAAARRVRDAAFGTRVTYSPKVFIPLTMLCRDRCGYCTFAKAPARLASPYLTPDEVLVDRPGRSRRRLPRGAVHPGRAARGPLPDGPALAGGARLRLDGRLPGRHVPPGARGDRPPAPRQRRRPLQGRAGGPAAGERQPGDDDRDPGRGGGAPPGPGQGPGPTPGHPRGGRRAGHPLHHRGAGRHRRHPDRPSGHPPGHRRRPPPARPRAGGDRPELPAQADHGHGLDTALPARGAGLVDRRGPPPAAARGPRAGPAQPLRRPRAAAGRRHRRLGWRVAGDRRPRQPRAGLARPRPAAGGHRGRWPHPGPEADHLPGLRPRPRALARPGPALPGARRGRRRGPGPRRPVVLGRRDPAPGPARPDR